MITRIGIIILSLSVTASSTPAVKETPALILSPYIEQNRLAEARNASLVNSTLFLNINSHAGFLTVDKKHDSNLYFWYFPVPDKPVNETPWIIWLQGGPGATSLAGLFDEIGPFEYKAGELRRRQWSWATSYSMLFIDNPVGAGFSFTNNEESFVKNMEACSSHLYSALQQFLTIFPELRTAPLFIAGESYAGRYVPAFGYKILEEQPAGNVSLNLKGLMMGNPIIDRIDAANISSVYYHWGLLDAQGLLATKPLQDQYSKAIVDGNVPLAWKLRDELLDLIFDITQQQSLFNLLNDSGNLHEFETYIAREDVRQAMHVGNIQFTFNNRSVDKALMDDFLGPIRPKLEKLLEHYKIMVYCGQLDLTAPCELGAASRRKYWHWSKRADFFKAPRRPWTYNGTLAGYIKQGGGLTEVLVRNSGHLVPRDAPAQAKQLIASFIDNHNLTISTFYSNKPEYTPEIAEREQSFFKTDLQKSGSDGMLTLSIVINVILAFSLVFALAYYLKWRRQEEFSNRNSRVYYSPLSSVTE